MMRRTSLRCTKFLFSSPLATPKFRFSSSLPNREMNKERKGEKERVEIKTKEGKFRGLTVLEESLPHDVATFHESLYGIISTFFHSFYFFNF
jgi:hypothetical protein